MPKASPPESPAFQASAAAHSGLWPWLMWRLNRLRCMSPGEIAYRLQRRLSSQAEAWRLIGTAEIPAPDLAQLAQPWIRLPPGIDQAACLAAADRLVAGKFDVFALHDIDLGSPPSWNRDPKTGIVAQPAFGKLLDYRNPALVGDIKYLWEPNRHLHLVTLAQAWAISHEKKYAETIILHLENWIDTCPYCQGPNWSSALEAGLRLINWSVTWQLLGGMQSPLFKQARGLWLRQRWLESIYRHAGFIEGYFSLHSSANNHLIGEAAGLFVAALTWPCWPEADTWRARAQAILEREARLQNADDGVNREQATAYQQFEIDLLLIPLLAGRANGVIFSAEYPEIIERMLEFVASIMDVGGHVPMFGDADDGVVLRLSPDDSQAFRYRSSLATGAILFQRADFKAKAGALDDKTRWLLGAEAEARYAALASGPATLPVRQAFVQGGYYILGCDFGAPNEIRLIADAGPLGYQRIAAHGHADALSFTLSLGGVEFLVDPGTYAYHTEGPWRDYFRGTSAHNTARVDGLDQSTSGGNFMWLDKAVAQCSDWQSGPDEDVFEGHHDGYRRLPDPVTHQRRIVFDKATRRITIEDRFQMKAEHEVELFFHCSEDCLVEPFTDGYAISLGDKRLLLRLPEDNRATHPLLRGNVVPILGWVSRRFDEKHASTTLRWSGRLSGTCLLVSQIQCC